MLNLERAFHSSKLISALKLKFTIHNRQKLESEKNTGWR